MFFIMQNSCSLKEAFDCSPGTMVCLNISNQNLLFLLAATTTEPLTMEFEKYGKNHTTYASLVIALGFGTLFLFAALILIGRPWWYAFHRPRYSKVDYLMNGL